MNKVELRKRYLEIRKTTPNKVKKSRMIFDNILKFLDLSKIKCVGIYVSTPHEVDTCDLINYFLKNNIQVVVPKTHKEEMKFYKISSLSECINVSSFGILEPSGNIENFVDSQDINVMFCPLVAFDEELYRLGYGKGYYDRYLSNFKGIKIGLAYHCQLTNEEINHDSHDVPMDIIFTERGFFGPINL